MSYFFTFQGVNIPVFLAFNYTVLNYLISDRCGPDVLKNICFLFIIQNFNSFSILQRNSYISAIEFLIYQLIM